MPAIVRGGALLVALCAALGLAAAARAADPKAPSPDSEFLEYLGSGDDVDDELQQYLTRSEGPDSQDAKPAPKRGSGKT